MTQTDRRLYLIAELLKENPEYKNISIPKDEEEQKILLRSLFNLRMPKTASKEFLQFQDEYLKHEVEQMGIVNISNMEEVQKNIYLWKGDITRIKADCIVNAANETLLGCFQPCHSCIDNAIHTFAGIQLRLECNDIIKKCGGIEKVENAKITFAYNLPCKYIIHTVGPIVDKALTDEHEKLLRSSYNSCLELVKVHKLNSIAFCCISTGVFGFPKKEAAKIAVEACQSFLKNTDKDIKIIFDVFTDKDEKIYRELLK